MICKIGETEIHYHVRGHGRPLLMLHGITVDHRSILALDTVFEAHSGWQRIYLDLPGMGQSPGGDVSTSGQMLEVLEGFVDRVIGKAGFAVFGASYGGYLAQGLVIKRSEQVAGLGLLCPVVQPDPSLRALAELTPMVRDTALLDTLTKTQREEFEAYCVVQSREVWQRAQHELQVGRDIMDAGFVERLQGDYGFSFPVLPLAIPFERPALIVTGRQDNIVGFADTIPLLQSYPHASFAVLDRAGHNLQLEQDTLLKTLFSEWLHRMEEAGAEGMSGFWENSPESLDLGQDAP